jgi:hypothetical protein
MADRMLINCKGCGRTYTMGVDAIVITIESMGLDAMHNAPGITIFGNRPFFENTPDKSDLIASLGERSWDSLEPETIDRQKTEIGIILSAITEHQQRWWRCQECDTVQIYTV